MYPIHDIDPITMAFPVTVKHLMPEYDDIPAEFKNHNNKWNRVVSKWFFDGISTQSLKAKEGVDKGQAIKHVGTILGSFEPQHEHKEAACAFLLSEWFEDFSG